MKINIKILVIIILFFIMISDAFSQQQGNQNNNQGIQLPSVNFNVDVDDESDDLVLKLQILAVMTILTLAPSILVMMTAFTRIIVVFHFLKQALGTHTQPPNQLLTSLALFLTFFIMQPVLNDANNNGIQPYMREEISQDQAVENIINPFREFMLKHTREKDLGLFIKLSGGDKPQTVEDVSIWSIIPAYAISELRVAFQIGFMLFVPFLILDMIIASTLMSLGMFLLPPQLISLPIKVLLFILVDGWYLIIESLMNSILN